VNNPPPGNPSDSTIDKVTLGMIISSLQKRQERRSRQSQTTSGQSPGKGEKELPERVRLVFHVDPLLLGRIQVQADRLGLSLGEYLSQAATKRLEADEAADPSLKKKKAAAPKKPPSR
jgi:hypothetical protein